MLTLFAILAIGTVVGHLSFRRISLGTAGVLFVAMVFGHNGAKIPREVMELGLLLFVYAVGLQAGPQFFRMFHRRGLQMIGVAVVSVGAGAILTAIIGRAMGLPYDLAAGMYTGALTCTPALAGVLEAAERISPGQSANLSVGYGLAYPLSMLGTVLLIQFLPALLRRDLAAAETNWDNENASESPALSRKQFRITNPNCDGKTISQINIPAFSNATVSRVRKGQQILTAGPDVALHRGDVVLAIGHDDELDKLLILFGEESNVDMEMDTRITAADMDVTEPAMTGKPIGELHVATRHGVIITRIRRQDHELVPGKGICLEMGDALRVVGEKERVQAFMRLVQPGRHKADETNMMPFLAGLLAGVIVGSIPITLAEGLTLKLGLAGGAFLVALLIGHFGRIGPMSLYVPAAARNLSRELGLMLFLAGAGTTAGARFMPVLQEKGWVLLAAGAAITLVTLATALLMAVVVFRQNVLSVLGAVAACMTNPPALGAAAGMTRAQLPTIAYASAYPAALIFKIVFAQILFQALFRMSAP